MRLCITCNIKIPYKILIDGKLHNIKNRKRCLKCNPWKKFHGGSLNRLIYGYKCKIHENSPFIRRPDSGFRCRQCIRDNASNRRRNNIKYLIKISGGCCLVCGYNKCLAALDFHHLDPSAKKFGISAKASCSMKILLCEVKKCILLCKICHTELENNKLRLSNEILLKHSKLIAKI